MAKGVLNSAMLLSRLSFTSQNKICRHLKNNCIYVYNTLFLSDQGSQVQMLYGAQAFTETRVSEKLQLKAKGCWSLPQCPEHLRRGALCETGEPAIWWAGVPQLQSAGVMWWTWAPPLKSSDVSRETRDVNFYEKLPYVLYMGNWWKI